MLSEGRNNENVAIGGFVKRLWVDIWDQITPVEEVMRGLDDLVRQGKILYRGLNPSNRQS